MNSSKYFVRRAAQSDLERLVSFAIAEAGEAGAVELRLDVHNGNRRAIEAYQKSGFLDSEYRIMTMFL